MRNLAIIGDVTIEKAVASDWNELTTEQLERVFAQIWLKQDIVAMRWQLLSILLEMPQSDIAALLDACGENTANVAFSLLSLTDFLFETTENGKLTVSTGLTKCPYPIIRPQNRNLIAPNDGLEHICFGEMAALFDCYAAWCQNASAYQNTILAILYRPEKEATPENIDKNYEGDRRLPIIGYEHTLEQRALEMTGLDAFKSDVILHWVGCCLKQISDNRKELFNGKGESDPFGFEGVVLRLGGLLEARRVEKTEYKEVLTHLRILEWDRKEFEKKNPI